jgi:hypothetical protein
MNRSILMAVLVFVLLCVLPGALARQVSQPGFVADGVGYYAPLASLLVDGDLDLRNELSQLNQRYLRAAYLTPDGRLGDPFPVGPALLWTPAVLLVSRLPAMELLDRPLPLPPRTRHPAFAPRFARAVQWSSALLVLIGGAFLAAALTRFVKPWIGAAMVAVLVWASPVFYYVFADPSYGHAASFFAVAMLTSASLIDRSRPLPLPLLGAAWGLVTVVRSQDAVFGLLLAPRLLDSWKQATNLRARGWLLLRFVVPAVLLFTPQMIFWNAIYGTPLLIPPGPDVLPLWKPQLLHLLFSTWNGVLPWAPLLLVGAIALVFFPDRRWRFFAWAAILLQLYTSAILLDWWGGGSFGPRRLVSIVPLAAVGLSCGLQFLMRSPVSWPRRFGVAGLVILSAALMLLPIRVAEYKLRGFIPLNPGNASQYVRHYAPGSPQARPWGHWDYPRLVREIRQAGRLMEIERRRQEERRR